MKTPIKFIGFTLICVLLTGCGVSGASPSATFDSNSILTMAAATAYVRLTQAAAIPTATKVVTPTETVAPTATQIVQPTSIPTIEPITATMDSNARVRGIPAKDKQSDLGGLFKGQSVRVIARNDEATWLEILYADSPSGTGWVIKGAVILQTDLGLLPIMTFPNGYDAPGILLPPFIFQITGTPLPPGVPPAGWTKYGTVSQQANVRIGPSTGFLAIGILSPGVSVTFQGRTLDGGWVQIDYPSGPGGHGWILTQLVKANDGYDGLPTFDVLGTPAVPTQDVPTATLDPNATPEPSATLVPKPTPGGADATITNQINVRSGPAQSYSSYGMVKPNEKVVVTGLTLNKYWYLIAFKDSPTGFGWVAAQFVRVTGDMRYLKYYNDQGTPVP